MSREIPEGWKSARLGALVEIERASFNIKEINSFDSVRLYSLPAFDSGAVPENAAGSEVLSNKYRVPTDCILFSKLNPRIPRVWRVRHEHQEPALGSTEFWPLRPKNSNVDLDFLTSFLTSADFLNSPEITPASSTNSHQRVDRKAFENFEILLPPLHEQRRIAEILSSVDEAIAATRAVIEQTRTVKQGVLERLLTEGIGHTRFKQTEIGEIPEGWEVKPLGEIAEIDRGKFSVRPRNDPRYFGGDVPFVQTGDVVSADGRLRRHSQTLNALGRGVSKVFPAGTILITIAANIGDTAITTYPVCCPDSVVGIVPNQGVNTDWLREFLVLQKPSLDRQATQNAQKNINLQHLRPMQIAVPPVDEQREIGRRIQTMNDSISQNGLELANMQLLKSALMSDLLTGRKRVTDVLPMAAE